MLNKPSVIIHPVERKEAPCCLYGKLGAKETRSLVILRLQLLLCNSFHVNIVEAFLSFRSFLSTAVSCHLKHSCFYCKVFRHPHLLALAAPFLRATGSNFFTCTLAPTIHIYLFHLFGHSPANKTCL